jgi:MSHA pilin protein MshD
MCSKPGCCRQTARGLTLIELLVFIVILGVATTAILGVFGSLTRSSANLLPEKQAQAFAASKLAEIMAQPFASVAAYNGLTALTFPNGTAVTSLPGYTMSITVNAAGSVVASAPPLAAVPLVDRLLVTVVVTAPSGAVARVSGIRIR